LYNSHVPKKTLIVIHIKKPSYSLIMQTTNQNWLANCLILFDQAIFGKTPYLGKGGLLFDVSKK